MRAIDADAIVWHDYLVSDGNGMYHDEKVAYKSQIDDLPSTQPVTITEQESDLKLQNSNDAISRQAAIDAICEHGTDLERRGITVLAVANYKQATVDLLESLTSADPDNRLEKIADLVEGTIDHFDLDDAMDLLYQIKGALKDG